MGVGSKLGDVHQELALLGEQGKAKGFFNNVENADKLVGLVEDIRDAVMDYQVCIPSNNSPSPCSYFLQTSLQQDIYNKSCLLIVSPGSSSIPFSFGLQTNRSRWISPFWEGCLTLRMPDIGAGTGGGA